MILNEKELSRHKLALLPFFSLSSFELSISINCLKSDEKLTTAEITINELFLELKTSEKKNILSLIEMR